MTLATKLGLKTEADLNWKLADLMPYIRKDKKVVGDRIQFVCLRDIGHAFVRPTRMSELKLLED